MTFFWMPNLSFINYSFPKISLWKSSELVHIVVKELRRLPDGLPNQSFCQSDISRVQVKSNWTVGESMLASDKEAVTKCMLNLLKWQTFSQCVI